MRKVAGVGAWILFWFATLSPAPSTAQVFGNSSAGMGYHTTPNPLPPNCAPGLIWMVTNGHASCQMPAAPTCPSGFTQTAAPTWNGSAWVGLQCLPSVPPSPIDDCVARAQAEGYSVDGTTSKQTTNRGSEIVIQLVPVYGDYYTDVSVYTNQYEYACFYTGSGNYETRNVYDYWFFHSDNGGGGG